MASTNNIVMEIKMYKSKICFLVSITLFSFSSYASQKVSTEFSGVISRGESPYFYTLDSTNVRFDELKYKEGTSNGNGGLEWLNVKGKTDWNKGGSDKVWITATATLTPISVKDGDIVGEKLVNFMPSIKLTNNDNTITLTADNGNTEKFILKPSSDSQLEVNITFAPNSIKLERGVMHVYDNNGSLSYNDISESDSHSDLQSIATAWGPIVSNHLFSDGATILNNKSAAEALVANAVKLKTGNWKLYSDWSATAFTNATSQLSDSHDFVPYALVRFENASISVPNAENIIGSKTWKSNVVFTMTQS